MPSVGSSEQLGQGPALFTICDADKRCSIDVSEDSVFEENGVVNASTGAALPQGSYKSMYAVGEAPVIPESLGESVDKYVPPLVSGQDFYVL